jgi:hypothetical protein
VRSGFNATASAEAGLTPPALQQLRCHKLPRWITSLMLDDNSDLLDFVGSQVRATPEPWVVSLWLSVHSARFCSGLSKRKYMEF